MATDSEAIPLPRAETRNRQGERDRAQAVVSKQDRPRAVDRDRETLEPYREWRGARSPKLAENVGRRATFDWAVSSQPFTVAAERGRYGFSIVTD